MGKFADINNSEEVKDIPEDYSADPGQSISRLLQMIPRGALPVATGATVGGLMGLMGGPASPVTVPAGVMLGSMALPLADGLTQGYNMATPDSWDIQMPSQAVSGLLDQYYPHPETTAERSVESGSAALTAAGTQLPALSNLALQGYKGAATMATAPRTQAAVSAPSAAAAQVTTEKTDNPLLGTATGVGVSMIGTLTPRGKTPAPTASQLKNEARNIYKQADDAGVSISGRSFANVADDITSTLKDDGYHPKLHPNIETAIDEVVKNAEMDSLSLKQLETLRKIVKSSGKNYNNPDEQRLAQTIIDKIDNYADDLSEADLINGDPAKGKILSQARSAWSKAKKSELLDEIVETAKDRAGANYTNAGLETAIRQQLKNIKTAKNKAVWNSFNKEEQKMITRIVRGDPVQNIFRIIGKAAPTGIVSGGIGAGVGSMVGGPVGAAAVPIAGFAGKNISTQMGLNNYDRLNQLVRLGQVFDDRGAIVQTPGWSVPMATRGLLSTTQ